MMKFASLSMLFMLCAQSALAEGRVCRTIKFGLNNSDEVCAVITPGKKNALVRLETDVATYDPVNPTASRQNVAAELCKLFDLGKNVSMSMTFRKSEQAGFLGGGAIIGNGVNRISTIDTIRCNHSK